MKVMWIDPGERFGWATAEVYVPPKGGVGPQTIGMEPGSAVSQMRVLDYGITPAKRFLLALIKRAPEYDIIGYEAYTVRPDKLAANVGTSVPTLQYIGAIRLCGWEAQRQRGDGHPKIISQDPIRQSAGRGAAKLIAGAEMQDVIESGYAGPHDDGHHASALAHMFDWYYRTYVEGS